MTKWVARLLMLGIAALLVSVIAYAVVQGGSEAVNPNVIPTPIPGGIRGMREGFNWYGIDQLLRPLILIAAIVVVVAPTVSVAKPRTKRNGKEIQ
jgi:hypothetical protein